LYIFYTLRAIEKEFAKKLTRRKLSNTD